MRRILTIILCVLQVAVCPPPQRQQAQAAQQAESAPQQVHPQVPNENPQHVDQSPPDDRKPMYEFTYSKYLEEVVKILESDPKFTERLKEMKEEEIKRLRQQISKQIEADGGAHNVKMPEHLDVQNIEKFHKEDLRKLIQKTVADMNEIDAQRKEQPQTSSDECPGAGKKAQHEAEEAKKRHNEHEKLKHPGSRDQLEEVWEESDHLDKDSFNPRTFFALHDLNGDGYWNDIELEALFQLELEKMYNDTNPDDDPRERMEEMYRMREHVSKQMDKNGDRLISLEEFLQDTEAQTPEKDEGWKDLGQQQVYTDEELQAFEKEYAQQQGWGDDAYKAVTVQPVVPSEHPQPVHQQVPVASQHQQPPQQQHQQQHPQQQQQHPAQPVVPQQPHGSVPVQPHQPIADLPKDPSYGI
ncbi:unnamed protein product [Caenorhabditis auriculariae]|uniref:NUCB1-like N-terminal domain-containing protein n=1 Tax=Caenorhabditis auriculariae TaxID=2777116 RepID=A0A8S1GP25_9PELO|nr:unnamed protein product [Caenorhabditis auriculariae]